MFENYHTVVHLAGGFSAKLNISGTKNLLEACRNFGVKRFIYMSSLDVFSSPETAYAMSKAVAENEVRSSGLGYCIVRPSIVYGDKDHNIYPLMRWIKRFPVGFIPGDGTSLRRPLYVDDLITRLVPACYMEDVPLSLNIAGRDVLSVREIFNKIIEKTVGVKKRYLINLPVALLRAVGVFSRTIRYVAENLVDKHHIRTDEEVLFGETDFSGGLTKMLSNKAVVSL